MKKLCFSTKSLTTILILIVFIILGIVYIIYQNSIYEKFGNIDNVTLRSMDRIYNPISYPYKSDSFYEQSWYPNLEIPFQVIGCGARNTPCLGGTQIPIYNPPNPLNISNESISPVSPSFVVPINQDPYGEPQQVGVIYKIYGNENEVFPLFGRRRRPNENRYDYYTIIGKFGSKVPVITQTRYDQLGNNDVVFIKGFKTPYRVTIYETDSPTYIPYL